MQKIRKRERNLCTSESHRKRLKYFHRLCFYLPNVQLHYCASSFSHAMNVHARRCQQSPLRVYSRRQYCQNSRPIPIFINIQLKLFKFFIFLCVNSPIVSHRRLILIYWLVEARFDVTSHTYMTQLIPRYKIEL